MAGQISFTLEEYQEAAVQYRPELLMLPIIGIEETTNWMTQRPGIRYKERVGQMTGKAQFAPYKAKRRTDAELKLEFRDLETHFGSVVAEFEPNSAVSTVLGKLAATKGDAQAEAPTAMHVLTLIARSLSDSLNAAIWSAKRNASGDTTQDLFDGFDTITEKEIAGGGISAEKGNYLKLEEAITDENAYDVAKKIWRSLSVHLRAEKEILVYCTQDFVDSYNEAYKLNTGAIPYNAQFEQQAVEGSGGRMKFVPLSNKVDSKFIHVSTRDNMLIGYDQMGDIESVLIKEYEPFILSYVATMFFGVQFETIDKSRLMVVELAE